MYKFTTLSQAVTTAVAQAAAGTHGATVCNIVVVVQGPWQPHEHTYRGIGNHQHATP